MNGWRMVGVCRCDDRQRWLYDTDEEEKREDLLFHSWDRMCVMSHGFDSPGGNRRDYFPSGVRCKSVINYRNRPIDSVTTLVVPRARPTCETGTVAARLARWCKTTAGRSRLHSFWLAELFSFHVARKSAGENVGNRVIGEKKCLW